jgi:hypothetical protein
MARTPPPIAPGGRPEVNYHRNLNQHLLDQDARVTALEAASSAGTPAVKKLMIHASAFMNALSDFITFANYVQAQNVEGSRFLASGSNTPSRPIWACIPLSVGDIIKQVDLYVLGAAAGTGHVLKCWKYDMTSAAATAAIQLGTTQTSAASATPQTLSNPLGSGEVVADGFSYFLSVTLNGDLSSSVRGARIQYL